MVVWLWLVIMWLIAVCFEFGWRFVIDCGGLACWVWWVLVLVVCWLLFSWFVIVCLLCYGGWLFVVNSVDLFLSSFVYMGGDSIVFGLLSWLFVFLFELLLCVGCCAGFLDFVTDWVGWLVKLWLAILFVCWFCQCVVCCLSFILGLFCCLCFCLISVSLFCGW